MSGAVVLDTNVLIVANGAEEHAPPCILQCLDCLEQSRNERIVLDDAFIIIAEYRKNVSEGGQPGAGDAFLRWLLQNMWNPERCEQVKITDDGNGSYHEFPRDRDLARFDRSDRKFVAVALQSAHNPEIVNAVDSDWTNDLEPLQRNGIRLRFLCD